MKSIPLTISIAAMAVSLSVLAGAVALSKSGLQSGLHEIQEEEAAAWKRLAAIEADHAAAAVPVRLVEKPGRPARYECTTKDGWMRSAPSREDLEDDCGDGVDPEQQGSRRSVGPTVDAAALGEWAKAYEIAKSAENL